MRKFALIVFALAVLSACATKEAVIYVGVVKSAVLIKGGWNQIESWDITFEGGTRSIVPKVNCPAAIILGERYEVIESSEAVLWTWGRSQSILRKATP